MQWRKEMKKILFLVVLMGMISLIGCGKKDTPADTPPKVDPALVGGWEITNGSWTPNLYAGKYQAVKIKSDGIGDYYLSVDGTTWTLSSTTFVNISSASNGNFTDSDGTGTYTISGTHLTYHYSTGPYAGGSFYYIKITTL